MCVQLIIACIVSCTEIKLLPVPLTKHARFVVCLSTGICV